MSDCVHMDPDEFCAACKEQRLVAAWLKFASVADSYLQPVEFMAFIVERRGWTILDRGRVICPRWQGCVGPRWQG